jgi:preprotein translocase subunit SecG
MTTLVTIIHVIAALLLILIILLQAGKGGGMGAAFGGASQNLFGGHGAAGFLAKITTAVAITFMLTSLGLSILSSSRESVIGDEPRPTKPSDSSALSTDADEADKGSTAAESEQDIEPGTPAPAGEPSAEAASPSEAAAADTAARTAPVPQDGSNDGARNPDAATE